MKKIEKNGMTITVVEPDEQDKYLTESDKEMDARAREAVRAAIAKAKFLKKPIARYDPIAQKSYIEYPSGEREYEE